MLVLGKILKVTHTHVDTVDTSWISKSISKSPQNPLNIPIKSLFFFVESIVAIVGAWTNPFKKNMRSRQIGIDSPPRWPSARCPAPPRAVPLSARPMARHWSGLHEWSSRNDYLSNEKRAPGSLVYMGVILPSYIGIIINHDKDPY